MSTVLQPQVLVLKLGSTQVLVLRPGTSGVDGHAGDPFGVGLELLGHFLFDEVVDADGALRGHEEVGPDGVEGHALDQTFVPPERVLAPPPAQLVDEHLEMAGVIGHHRRQVVSFGVPGHLVDVLQETTPMG